MHRKSDLKLDFINFEEDRTESHSYPMGILYISACLKKNGFTNIGYADYICLLRRIEQLKTSTQRRLGYETWEKLNEKRERNITELIAYLKTRKPHIIMLGPIVTPFLVDLIDLVERLRQSLPKPLILAGGPHFGKDLTLDNELIRRCPGLDAVVVGEAEMSILEVANGFHCKWSGNRIPLRSDFLRNLAEVRSLTLRNKAIISKRTMRMEDLPSPDMSLLEDYWNNPKTHVDYRYSMSKRRNLYTRTARAPVDDYSGDND